MSALVYGYWEVENSLFAQVLPIKSSAYRTPKDVRGHQERMHTVSGPTSRRFLCAPAPLTDVRPHLPDRQLI